MVYSICLQMKANAWVGHGDFMVVLSPEASFEEVTRSLCDI